MSSHLIDQKIGDSYTSIRCSLTGPALTSGYLEKSTVERGIGIRIRELHSISQVSIISILTQARKSQFIIPATSTSMESRTVAIASRISLLALILLLALLLANCSNVDVTEIPTMSPTSYATPLPPTSTPF